MCNSITDSVEQNFTHSYFRIFGTLDVSEILKKDSAYLATGN